MAHARAEFAAFFCNVSDSNLSFPRPYSGLSSGFAYSRVFTRAIKRRNESTHP
jgi:hypothetical protein